MRPVKPVILGANPDTEKVLEVGAGQEQYLVLPAIESQKGCLLSRWSVSDEELETIIRTRSIYLYLCTFGNPAPPSCLSVDSNLKFDLGYGEKVGNDIGETLN